ncbi:MAG: hypothetical protein WCG27_06055, partial [Pseudomonadota bacterium]
APIYLPREQKDHLLIEIPGSVESQMDLLFSAPVTERFGKKVGIIYPDNAQGTAYLDEFWRQAITRNIEVAGIAAYDKHSTDFREPVKRILGLESNRARQEEYDLFSEVYANEKSAIRRIQILRPQVHFNWMLIVANPKEAMQIIPSFAYFDAFHVNFWGGPSWRSSFLQKQSARLGKLYFVSDYEEEKENEFTREFIRINKSKPRLLESRSYDALSILTHTLGEKKVEGREEFDLYLREKKQIIGVTGQWSLRDGIWIKLMTPLQFQNNEIARMFGPNEGITIQNAASE